jgi:putative phage-type endonuclease
VIAAVATRRTRTPPIGSPGWHAQRRLAIFATDAAPAAGLSRFSDPVMLYLDKIGLTAAKIELERMKWGKVLEAPIARQWARENHRTIRHEPMTWHRDGLPFPMATHMDYWAGDELVEIKTASEYMRGDFGEDGTDQVPIDYRLQLVHELAVTGAERGHLVVLIGGHHLGQFVIDRDLETEGSLLQIEERLWDNVRTRTPPEIDGGEGSKKLLAMIEPDATLEIGVDEELAGLATAYLGDKAEEKALAEALAEGGNKIRALLGRATRARGGDIDIIFTENKPTAEINWEAVARSLAEDVTRHHGKPDDSIDVTLAGYLPKHTTLKRGNRPLLVRHKEA